MTDVALVLVIVLIVVVIWRGPRTLPLLGRAFGQGVKEAKKEIDGMKEDATEPKATPPATPLVPPPPPPPDGTRPS